jgi:hypothetical protein
MWKNRSFLLTLLLSALMFYTFLFSGDAIGMDLNPDSLQDVTLSGYIISETDGEYLEGATVYVEELDRGTATNERGFFSLTMPPGSYTVVIRYLGMETKTMEIELISSIQVEILLEEGELGFEEIIVEAADFRAGIRRSITGVETARIRDLRDLPQLMGEIDVIENIIQLPGVQSVGEGASGFNVRGGRADQNLTLMDGAPVYNASHILGLFSVYNPDVHDSYTLYKGHIPEQYGGRLSSVLDVNTRRGSAENYKVRGGIGLYSGRIAAEGPIVSGRTSFLLSARGADSDIIFTLAGRDRDLARVALPSDVYNSRARFYDTNAILTHRFSDRHILTFSYYKSENYFRYSNEFGYSWNNDLGHLRLRSLFSDNFFSEISVSHTGYRGENFELVGPQSFTLNRGIRNRKVKSDFHYLGFERVSISFGSEMTWHRSRPERFTLNTDPAVSTLNSAPADRGHELAFYAGKETELTPWLILSAGARFSMYNQLGPALVNIYHDGMPRQSESITDVREFSGGERVVHYSGIEPRVSVMLKFDDDNALRLSYNRARQYVHQISNSTSPTPADIWQLSGYHIPPQTADSYAIGFYRDFDNNNIRSSVELYFRNLDNQIEYIDFARLVLNPAIETELVSARGEAYGGEFSIRKLRGRWTGFLNYAYGRTFFRTTTPFEESAINRGEWFPADYDQPHNVSLTAVRALGSNSAFSFSFNWRSGRPITALSAGYLDQGTTVPIFSDRNQARIPDYIRLDVSFTIADHIWKNRAPNPDSRNDDSLNITLYNVLGRPNPFSVFYMRGANSDIPVPNRLSVLGAVIPSVTYNFSF